MDCSIYLSIQVPGILAPTLRVAKPFFSNTVVYQGLRPAERKRTFPPVFKARCNACTWVMAWESVGENQSMLSMTLIVLVRSACENVECCLNFTLTTA